MSRVRCQMPGCGSTIAGESADSYARSLGWIVYDGPSVAGTRLQKTLCPYCLGKLEPEEEEQW